MSFRPDLSWEFLSADEIETRTLRALRNHIRHLKEVSPYYKEILQNISHQDIIDLNDFEHLELTSKNILSENTDSFISTSSQQIRETVLTNGTTGNPLVFSLTGSDLERIAFNEALSFYSLGICSEDAVQIMLNFDRPHINGMAYYRGLTLLGCNTMRTGALSSDMHRSYLDLLKPTVIVTSPSFLKNLAFDLQKKGFDTVNSSIKKIICSAENIRTKEMDLNAIGKTIQQLWGADVYSSYYTTEISVSYCECIAGKGGHGHPELVYTEIIDEHGNVLSDGVPGELVVTTLGVEGMPLLRYRTGDISFKISQPCMCGRNSVRIGPVLGRKSQMIKMKGNSLFPSTITDVLDQINEINDYILVIENDGLSSDRVAIHVAALPSSIEKIANRLRVDAEVNLPILVSNLPTIQSMRGAVSGKKIRILDWRRNTDR